eukprot:5187832-Alexandrium_andersonii.AAC.1
MRALPLSAPSGPEAARWLRRTIRDARARWWWQVRAASVVFAAFCSLSSFMMLGATTLPGLISSGHLASICTWAAA